MHLKKMGYFFLLILSFILMPLNVWAKDEVQINITSSQTHVDVGQDLEIKTEISTTKNLYALTATLSYDNAVFESINSSNFILGGNWSDVVYNATNKKFGLINKSGKIENGNIFTLKLHVKENAKVGGTYINLSNIETSDALANYKLQYSSFKVIITKDAAQNETIPTTSKQNTVSKEQVKKAFPTKTLMIITSFLAIIFILLCIFLKNKNKKKTLGITLGLFISTILIITLLFWKSSGKTDTNKDGKTDYNDAKDIIKYLIDLDTEKENSQPQSSSNNLKTQKTKSKEESNIVTKLIYANTETENKKESPDIYDVNNDGKVDTQDVADNVEHVTEQKYQITFKETKRENYYYQKGSEVTLNFAYNVEPEATITHIDIDGQKYAVTKKDDYYTVIVLAPNKAGVHNFNFTKAYLDNGREIDINFKMQGEILKDKPVIKDFEVIGYDEKDDEVKFILNDSDEAFKEGQITIFDINNAKVLEEKIKRGENTFNYKFERDHKYKAFITASYDLDTNALNDLTDSQNEVDKETILETPIEIDSEYAFKISNIKITDVIEKGEYPVLSFNCTNDTEYKVAKVILKDGSEHVVTAFDPDTNLYLINLPINNKAGEYFVDIDKFVLESGVPFVNGVDFAKVEPLEYIVLKETPKANVNIQDNAQSKSLNAKVEITDPDKVIKKVKIALTDINNNILDFKEFNDGKNSYDVTFSYNDLDKMKYRIKVLADYDLAASHNLVEKELAQAEITVTPNIYIKAQYLRSDAYKYPKKSEIIYVNYEIVVPTDLGKATGNMVSGLTINGLNYTALRTKAEGSLATYTVSLKVPDQPGITEIKTTRVMFLDGSIYDVAEKNLKVDVLRDKPYIENFKVEEENHDLKTVKFSFDIKEDVSGEFKNGQLVLNNQQTQLNLQLGHNEVTFDSVPANMPLQLEILADYDLDTNTLTAEDNYYLNEPIFTTTYGLYDESLYQNAQISNLKAISKKGNKYFEKDEEIKLVWDFDGLDPELNTDIDKIIYLDKEYAVTKENGEYFTYIEGTDNVGLQEITISDIILKSGKVMKLTNPAKCTVDILKDTPQVNNFSYEEKDNKITIEMQKIDPDRALNGNLIIKIFDEDNKQIGSDYEYEDRPISFKKDKNIVRYYIKVYGSYDRDSEDGNANNYPNALLLDEVISFAENRIELKDITDTVLFKSENNVASVVENVDTNDIEKNKNKYYVKITMSSMPDIYCNIKRVEINEDNHLILVLDYDGQISENGKEVEELKIDYGKVEGEKATNDARPETFASLIEKIKANPSGEYILDHDLDATGFDAETSYLIAETFTGTLNGQGHAIKNLNLALFQKTEGATIKNLRFNNIKLKADSKGLIAETVSNSKISGILVDFLERRNGVNGSGALVGQADNGTVISQSKVSNLQFYNGTYNQVIGGIVGRLNNAQVENCYVTGSMEAGWHFIGGIAGIAENNAAITNCYTKITFGFSFDDNGNGGIAGSNGVRLQNNVSLSTGNYGYGVVSGKPLDSSLNNYQLTESKFNKNEGEAFITTSQADINANFFKDKAKFTEDIWELPNSNYDNPPLLKIEKTSIPNSDRIKENEKYDENKEILYKNLYLLMPFYDSEKVVVNGEKIEASNILNQQEIAHIIPLDEKGNLVTYLTKTDYKKIKKLKLVFKNEQVKSYNVVFDKLNGSIVGYRISDLKIDYTYNHYLIDENSSLVNNLLSYLEELDYTNDLDPLTTINDSRLYRDHYNEVTKYELKEFLLKYLTSSNQTAGEGEIAKYIEQNLKENDKLKKVLYVYNYLSRWYNVDINGIKLHDFTFFNMTCFNSILNPDDITLNFLAYEANFETDHTNNTYNRIFKPYTNITDVTQYIEYLIKIFKDNATTADSWFANTFQGYLLELNIDDRADITYTAWSHIRSTWQNYALVILTLPKNSTYILSSPTQFLIGSERTYVANPDTKEGAEALDKLIREYAVKVKTYYTTASKIIQDAKYFNAIHNIQIDHRFTKDENGQNTYQSPYVTEEGFHKNFSEPLYQFTNDNGTAAGANGSQVKYVAYSALTAYGTWSHESAHNQDARLFLLNNGRRWNAGGEDYADGNLSQRWSSGEISMNISIEYDEQNKNNISTNLSPSRIDSPQKIHDFYNKLFDTYYILDYLEAQAFVQLTKEEQAALAFKVSYKNIDSADESQKYKTTQYSKISAEEIGNMNLMGKGLGMNAVESLYDNMLTVYPGMPSAGTYFGDNKYGAEKLQKTRWYAPYNDYGRPDSYSLKLFAYEMLGYKGYVDGYVEYYSNIHADVNGVKTDLMALKKITGNDNITFKQYRMDRFKQAEGKLAYINYLDANTFVKEMYQALKQDAQNIMDGVNNADQLANSSKVKMDAYYAVKNGTNDFVDSIYSTTPQRTINDFKIN